MSRASSRAVHAARRVGFVCAVWSACAAGASLEVNPVRLTLTATQPVAALTVRNTGALSTGLHLQVMAWTQADGADQYAATRELLATPPIFTLAPGATQTVRVGLRRAIDPERELAYRLFLQEIPDSAAPQGLGVRIALRLGIPVFVLPRAPAVPLLSWRAKQEAGAIVLHAQNAGKAHARIIELKFLADSQTVGKVAGAYVLPGQSWRWRLAGPPMPAAGAQWRVNARTDMGNVHADVALE